MTELPLFNRRPVAPVENPCGTCSMCCKVMTIPEVNKADGEWCRHVVKKKGCGIYPDRPQRCRDYLCGWKFGLFQGPAPPELRPDKCKVVFSASDRPDVISAHCDPSHPEAWRQSVVLNIISQLANQGIMIVVSPEPGNRKRLFQKQGLLVTHRWITMSDPDENGIQWFTEDEK